MSRPNFAQAFSAKIPKKIKKFPNSLISCPAALYVFTIPYTLFLNPAFRQISRRFECIREAVYLLPVIPSKSGNAGRVEGRGAPFPPPLSFPRSLSWACRTGRESRPRVYPPKADIWILTADCSFTIQYRHLLDRNIHNDLSCRMNMRHPQNSRGAAAPHFFILIFDILFACRKPCFSHLNFVYWDLFRV